MGDDASVRAPRGRAVIGVEQEGTEGGGGDDGSGVSPSAEMQSPRVCVRGLCVWESSCAFGVELTRGRSVRVCVCVCFCSKAGRVAISA